MSFQTKRGHLCFVALGRKVFEAAEIADMTPARFDLMYLLHSQPGWLVSAMGYSMHQSVIRQKLGVSRQTVSVMVDRLVELGLVTKERPSWGDGRTNLITLTEEGVRRFRRALHEIFTLHKIADVFTKFATEGQRFARRAKWKVHQARDGFWWNAWRLARHLGDTSETIYHFPWEPDH